MSDFEFIVSIALGYALLGTGRVTRESHFTVGALFVFVLVLLHLFVHGKVFA